MCGMMMMVMVMMMIIQFSSIQFFMICVLAKEP